MSVSYMTHPLIRHKITLLRKEDTSTNEFRKLVEEIAMLMGYEALSDLETQEITVKTPIEASVQPVISGKKLAVVPILRAGLGMVNGILALVFISSKSTAVRKSSLCQSSQLPRVLTLL